MQVMLNAPALAGFSLDSIRDYLDYKLKRIHKLLPQFEGEHQIRVSVQKQKNQFAIAIEVQVPQPVFVTAKSFDLYAAIDEALKTMKRSLRKTKERKADR